MKILDPNGLEVIFSPVNLTAGSSTAPSLRFATGSTVNGLYATNSSVNIVAENVAAAAFQDGQLNVNGRLGLGAVSSPDVTLAREAAATLRLGVPVSPTVDQTLKAADGSGTNGVGAALNLAGGKGRDTGAGGSIIFQTAPAGGSGSGLGTLTTRMTIDAAGNITLSGTAQFSGTSIAGLRLNNLTAAQRDALSALAGMLLWNSTENAVNFHNGSAWKGIPQHALEATQRVFQSRLPNVATAITLTSAKAYFVYMGRTVQPMVVKYVEFYVDTAGTGAQTAEVGLFSSTSAPNKSDLTLTVLDYKNALDSLTSNGVKRNTTAFSSTVPAGTHLWAGLRCAMATNQPALAGLCMDFTQGLVQGTASAAAFTGSGTWSGVRISPAGPNYLSSPVAPDLRLVLD